MGYNLTQNLMAYSCKTRVLFASFTGLIFMFMVDVDSIEMPAKTTKRPT